MQCAPAPTGGPAVGWVLTGLRACWAALLPLSSSSRDWRRAQDGKQLGQEQYQPEVFAVLCPTPCSFEPSLADQPQLACFCMFVQVWWHPGRHQQRRGHCAACCLQAHQHNRRQAADGHTSRWAQAYGRCWVLGGVRWRLPHALMSVHRLASNIARFCQASWRLQYSLDTVWH